MGYSTLRFQSHKNQADISTVVQACTIACLGLHPLSQEPWERSVKLWSQKKTGQDEASLMVSSGVLTPVITVDVTTAQVLVHPQRKGEPGGLDHIMRCDPDMPAVLRSMQYNELKEVTFAGTKYGYGDIEVVVGSVNRKTSDTQGLGCFLVFKHLGTSMTSVAKPVLQELEGSLLDRMKKQSNMHANWTSVNVPELQFMSDCFTELHEAATYWAAANSM